MANAIRNQKDEYKARSIIGGAKEDEIECFKHDSSRKDFDVLESGYFVWGRDISCNL